MWQWYCGCNLNWTIVVLKKYWARFQRALILFQQAIQLTHIGRYKGLGTKVSSRDLVYGEELVCVMTRNGLLVSIGTSVVSVFEGGVNWEFRYGKVREGTLLLFVFRPRLWGSLWPRSARQEVFGWALFRSPFPDTSQVGVSSAFLK